MIWTHHKEKGMMEIMQTWRGNITGRRPRARPKKCWKCQMMKNPDDDETMGEIKEKGDM